MTRGSACAQGFCSCCATICRTATPACRRTSCAARPPVFWAWSRRLWLPRWPSCWKTTIYAPWNTGKKHGYTCLNICGRSFPVARHLRWLIKYPCAGGEHAEKTIAQHRSGAGHHLCAFAAGGNRSGAWRQCSGAHRRAGHRQDHGRKRHAGRV